MKTLLLTRRSALINASAVATSTLLPGPALGQVRGNKILIAGATGVVGHTALEHFAALSGWDVVAISRSKPQYNAAYTHIVVDLTDEVRCREVFGQMSDITHVVYTALHDRAGPIKDRQADVQLDTNYRMLRNLLEPLKVTAKNLKSVIILQGTKAYGVHIQPFKAPAKERWPRFDHDNFYFLQEDYLKDAQIGQSWGWTVFRPQTIFGFAVGKSMNLIPVIGALAAICREEGKPLVFPGTSNSVLEATDSRLLARAFEWAGIEEEARNEIFNIANGDIFIWPHVWPSIADALKIETVEGEPFLVHQYFKDKANVWDEVVQKHGLLPLTLSELVGQSDFFSDVGFTFAAQQSMPGLVSTIKIRQAGFHEYFDTEDAFRYWFDLYAERGLLPKVR